MSAGGAGGVIGLAAVLHGVRSAAATLIIGPVLSWKEKNEQLYGTPTERNCLKNELPTSSS